jgi:hypothetical protein
VLDLAGEAARGQPLWGKPDDEGHEHWTAIVPPGRPTAVQRTHRAGLGWGLRHHR